MLKKYLLVLSILSIYAYAEDAATQTEESGATLQEHIKANIEALQEQKQTDSIAMSVSALKKLALINDARNQFFTAQKMIMEELAGELKKIAEYISTLSKVEAAIKGENPPTNNAAVDNDGSAANDNGKIGSVLMQHIQAIVNHLEALPQTDEINAIVDALLKIGDLEQKRHSFSTDFKQTLEAINTAMGELPKHIARLEAIKTAVGVDSSTLVSKKTQTTINDDTDHPSNSQSNQEEDDESAAESDG